MINLVIALHCHQPVGNFDHVFNMAMKKCYCPVLDILSAHPTIKSGLHISGPLLEWAEKNQPDFIDILADMVERGQIELLSGGFFEPLLAAIPARDAKGQVLMMNEYIEKRFGIKPTGFWLTERIWDPNLPKLVEGTGMDYTIVDDTHFYYSGLKPSEIYGSYITEKEGSMLYLLATPMVMRYLIPFKPVEEVMAHLKSQEDMGRVVALYGDDGEKFGLWPGTNEWVIQKGWLDKFFTAIEENAAWLKTTLPGDFVSSYPSLGRLYLPQASYEEMTEWALPARQSLALEGIISALKNNGRWDEWRPFVRGGIWDNFLVKYEESNRMHKKMLFISERVDDDKDAREYLWRAQCNCAYWHGVFGGLYLGHLRHAIHENLIKAQECLIKGSGKVISLVQHDIDKDGHEEIMIWTPKLGIGISPHMGGGIFDLSCIPRGLNLSDTLTRRFEAYHDDIGKTGHGEQGKHNGIDSIHDISGSYDQELKDLLIYDDYSRISLLDHFLGKDASVEGYSRNDYPEEAGLYRKEYGLDHVETGPERAIVKLSTESAIRDSKVSLRKGLQVSDESGVTIDYEFENIGTKAISTRFGCEFNLNLYSDKDPERYYYAPESERVRRVSETGIEDSLTRFDLVNKTEGLILAFNFSRPVSAWFYPIMTVSKSEEGFEQTYQGSSLLFVLPLDIHPGKKDVLQIQMDFRLI